MLINISATSDPLVLRSPILPRSAIPAIAIMAVAFFSSLIMTGEPRNLLPLPLSLRAKDHTLSLTLHAAIARVVKKLVLVVALKSLLNARS